MSAIRVLVADDHVLFRAGLKSLLDQQGAIEVIGEASDGHEVLALVAKLKPDVVLLDISMPRLNGLDALRRLRETGEAVRVIMLSMHSDRRYVTESIKAGAQGYLLKDSTAEELLAGIRAVHSGHVHLGARVADVLVDDYVALSAGGAAAGDPLSSRERQVLQMIAEGHSTKSIADCLHVSVKTVETHRRNLMDKLNLHSVAELTTYAIRQGMITPE